MNSSVIGSDEGFLSLPPLGIDSRSGATVRGSDETVAGRAAHFAGRESYAGTQTFCCVKQSSIQD
jgi:hypothetical protein